MLYSIYFSGRGTTRAYAGFLANELGQESKALNLLDSRYVRPGASEMPVLPAFGPGDVLLLSMPVYAGLIPFVCSGLLEKLQGHGTPAVIAAIYGNRHYDDALAQMRGLLERQGFHVLAAGAFIARHSIFPKVAADRPDADDYAAASAFASRCRELLAVPGRWSDMHLELPGNPHRAYPERSVPGLCPDGDENCTDCGSCADACPAGAIATGDFRATIRENCIQCGACIEACPTGARNYHGEAYCKAEIAFGERCAAYRKPETFYAVC